MDLRSIIQNVDVGRRMEEHGSALRTLSARFQDEPEFRNRLDRGENSEALAAIRFSVPPGGQVRFSADTPDTLHFVMSMDPNTELSDESLGEIAAGGKSVGSASTVGSFGCSTTASSAGTAGSAGTTGGEE